MKKILITGATGFVGKHLIDHLLEINSTDKIIGTYISDLSQEDSLNYGEKVDFVKIDLNNEQDVLSLISDSKPDYIYHLAALSSASDSFDNPKETLINNVVAQVNLLEAARKSNLIDTRILIISSAEIYGNVKVQDLPIREETPLNPTSPYAVSKITQDYLALQYFNSYNLKTIRVRPFNHIGPGQSPNFVVSAFTKKVAEIEKAGEDSPTMKVGNLESKRDFTDVRDVVKAYSLLIEKGKPGDVYNLGSGKSYKISEILNKILALSQTKIKTVQDELLLRPFDNADLTCDCSKLINATGWKPEIPLEKTLKDTLDYWRNII